MILRFSCYKARLSKPYWVWPFLMTYQRLCVRKQKAGSKKLKNIKGTGRTNGSQKPLLDANKEV